MSEILSCALLWESMVADLTIVSDLPVEHHLSCPKCTQYGNVGLTGTQSNCPVWRAEFTGTQPFLTWILLKVNLTLQKWMFSCMLILSSLRGDRAKWSLNK